MICPHCGDCCLEPRRRTLADGRTVVVRQCMNCYEPVGVEMPRSKFTKIANHFDGLSEFDEDVLLYERTYRRNEKGEPV
jgi:hypothetical protein